MSDARTVGAADTVIGPAPERLEEIRGRFGITEVEPYLEAREELFRERRFIDVGIFGRFKAGKSSLLDHLARQAVLPVGVTPVTTIITRLRSGAEKRATVEYLDGRSKLLRWISHPASFPSRRIPKTSAASPR